MQLVDMNIDAGGKLAMRNTMIPLALQEPSEITKGSHSEDHDIFANIKPSLLKQTQVPLRLPSFLPVSGDKTSSLHAIMGSVYQQAYEIQLAWTEDCEGGNYCHYGSIRGSRTPLVEENRKRIPVMLEGGIKGYFIPFTCGAHCDDSSIGWHENGYQYSISLKAENMKTMVRVANSAIAAGRKARSSEPALAR